MAQIGAIIQTASPNYAALTIGRFIGGFGVGMLAMVARKDILTSHVAWLILNSGLHGRNRSCRSPRQSTRA